MDNAVTDAFERNSAAGMHREPIVDRCHGASVALACNGSVS
jgi:hypothetical protein